MRLVADAYMTIRGEDSKSYSNRTVVSSAGPFVTGFGRKSPRSYDLDILLAGLVLRLDFELDGHFWVERTSSIFRDECIELLLPVSLERVIYDNR